MVNMGGKRIKQFKGRQIYTVQKKQGTGKSKPIKTTAHRYASQFTDDKRDYNFFF